MSSIEQDRLSSDNSGVFEDDLITREDLNIYLGSDYRERVKDKLSELKLVSEFEELSFLEIADAHSNSDARYILDIYVTDCEGVHRALAYFIQGGQRKTSRHFHEEPITETYYVLSGKLILYRGDEETILTTEEQAVVKPGITHYAKTGDLPAFVLVIMHNAGSVPLDRQHLGRSPAP